MHIVSHSFRTHSDDVVVYWQGIDLMGVESNPGMRE